MRLTWMGTATFLLEAAEERILFDPFVELYGGSNPTDFEELVKEETVFITHGHFDHMYLIPELLEYGDMTVFCTEKPAGTLEQYTEKTGNIAVISPGTEIPIGEIRLRVLKGAHIQFDRRQVRQSLNMLGLIRYHKNLPYLAYANHKFKEFGETVAYEITAEGKKILLLGSLALDPEETYPTDVDLLILPYQGSVEPHIPALEIVRRIRPKRIVLSHFDNAYPPLSREVDTRRLKYEMEKEFPQIKVVKPTAGKPIIIS